MSKLLKWIIGIAIALVVITIAVFVVRAFLPISALGIMPFEHRWTTHWPGMMGYWHMPFGGLFGGLLSLGLLVLAVLFIVWLVRSKATPAAPPAPAAPALTCPRCNEPVQVGWVACPHCGKKL